MNFFSSWEMGWGWMVHGGCHHDPVSHGTLRHVRGLIVAFRGEMSVKGKSRVQGRE